MSEELANVIRALRAKDLGRFDDWWKQTGLGGPKQGTQQKPTPSDLERLEGSKEGKESNKDER